MGSPRHERNWRIHSAFLLLCAAVTLLSPRLLHAQSVPDAGSVLQQIEQERRTPLPPSSDPLFMPPAPMRSLAGDTVTVTAFRFELTLGATGPDQVRRREHL